MERRTVGRSAVGKKLTGTLAKMVQAAEKERKNCGKPKNGIPAAKVILCGAFQAIK